MSKHPFIEKAKSSHKEKMRKEGVLGEGGREKARRIAYADGGEVDYDLPNPFMPKPKPPRKPKPTEPTPLPPNALKKGGRT